ncbi:hypothetical protein [Pseudoalteromonas galatheae]|uniref:hypothetical protein n=1 Tax=Pseudoalteromonas galatheae TaxID=579562 RepID=UPI0030D410D1
MKILKFILILLCITTFLSIFIFNKEALACEITPFMGFKETYPEIYADDSMKKTEQGNFIELVQKAKKRVDEAFGKMSSNPRYIVSKKSTYWKFGFNPTGMARSSLFRECVFIGPKGINIDVIAHETAHAEVFHRANFFTKNFKMKPWLLEGSGTYVDYRHPLLLENINIDSSKVNQVMELSDFSPREIWAYQASRVAFEKIDPKKLYEGIDRLNSGESFDAVFAK